MKKSAFGLLISALVLSTVSSVSLPKSITLCHRSDPDISNCLKNAMTQALVALKDGNEELHLEKIDPLYTSELILIQSKTNKNFHLSMSYKDLYTEGLSKIQFDKFRVKVNDTTITIDGDAYFPGLVITGKYQMFGKLLLFSIRGMGKAYMNLQTMNAKVSMVLETDELDGVKYLILKHARIITSPPKQTKLNFEDIIKGNAKLSQQMNKVMEDNVAGLHEIFSPSIEAFFTSILTNAASKVFALIPMDELLPP